MKIVNLSFKILPQPRTFDRLDIGDKFLLQTEFEMSDRGLGCCRVVWVKVSETEGIKVDSIDRYLKELSPKEAVYLLHSCFSSLPKIEEN